MKVLAAGTIGALVFASVALACVGDNPDLGPPPDAGQEAGDSVLDRGDFENASCLGWEPNEATAQGDTSARSGASSCRVCDAVDDGSPNWGIFQVRRDAAAGVYEARLYARTSGDLGPSRVTLAVQPTDRDGNLLGSATEREVTIATNDVGWSTVVAEVEIAEGQGIAVALMSNSGGACFLVDDVTLRRK